MNPTLPDPVKLFFGFLWGPRLQPDEILPILESRFGPTERTSPVYPFDVTDYYDRELGGRAQRRFVSFERLVAPEDLVEIKLWSNRIEEEHSVSEGGRRINLDPGYLDIFKVVLASAKPGWQKIHLGRGIWADPTLFYRKGAWHPFEWSFPDFRLGSYDRYFLDLRSAYKARLREILSSRNPSAHLPG